LPSYVIAAPQLTFGVFESLIVTARQTAADGISIEVKTSVGVNSNANAKAVSATPSGNMFLGCGTAGAQQANGAFEFIEYYSPAPLTSRQIN